jgi:formylglycine-generating enzyme required for sulfatase activity
MKILSVLIMALLFTVPVLRAQSISMSYVTVGNPGNAGDPATASASGTFGSVSYTYDIGEYDVTDSQYCTFLNDVDPTGANTLALYSPQGDAEFGITFTSGAAGGSKYSVIPGYANMPVVDVSFWDTLRFVNWMNNGEGNASTETGAYTLLGGNTDGYGTPSNAASFYANPQHNAGATVWLPNENEWYKAAYYNPANGTYSTYATQSDTTPGNVIGNGANEANTLYYNGSQYLYSVTQSSNYNSSQNYLTAVGSYTGSKSYYGTYDQSGDVYNWTSTSTVVSSGSFVLRGGYWGGAESVASNNRSSTYPAADSGGTGFRVAAVPEPSTWVLIGAGVGALLAFRRRRRS